jgi:hypothetical protein
MKRLKSRSIQRLGKHVTGDAKLTRYRSGPELVTLFNEFGFDDRYAQGFPSRWQFTEERLDKLNGTEELARLIEAIFDPLEFKGNNADGVPLDLASALIDMNEYLRRDDFEVNCTEFGSKLRTSKGSPVTFAVPTMSMPAVSEEFIAENVRKCELKLRDGDHAGAITNARSLIEDVLCEVERRLDGSTSKYDGDLPKLYKRVRKFLTWTLMHTRSAMTFCSYFAVWRRLLTDSLALATLSPTGMAAELRNQERIMLS